MTDPVQLVPVASKAELERFIRLPGRLMADDRNYIAPLWYERREALSAKHNPFFEHAEAQYWLATRGGRDVGRISAQIDRLAPTAPAAPEGHFGLIAAEDDPEVFALLFAAAESWLAERGRVRAMGPFNLSINEEVGLLVDGFDTPPMLLMGHDAPYVGRRVEEQGYAKAKDVLAYISGIPTFTPGVQARLGRPLPPGMVLRQIRMDRFDDEIEALVGILNDGWAENWG
ncbi:MAG: dATP pyrophosphohydrolase, partial [Caulobacteraceae bacterium]|nr:dATP pyrophosphohydrolase [Caulobacteraceae bacterium]